MERYLYVKVLLYAYPRLNELSEAIADGAEVKALLSFRTDDALRAAERVAEAIATANRLRLLKETLDEALGGCSEDELFLLEYKYFRRKSELKGRFSGYTLSVSERSYFRMQNALLGKVGAALTLCGLTERAFFQTFGRFSPFMRVYRALSEGREHALVQKRKKRGIGFQNSGS